MIGAGKVLEALHSGREWVASRIRDVERQVARQETWLELIADAKAERVAEEFGKLLDERAKAGGKLHKDDLKKLVHAAVLQSR